MKPKITATRLPKTWRCTCSGGGKHVRGIARKRLGDAIESVYIDWCYRVGGEPLQKWLQRWSSRS